jgi:MOSC domain-containing protein YiiM
VIADGRVEGVACDSQHRFSKSARDRIILLKGLGVEGDAHAGRLVQHQYLARHRPTLPNMRQVHLIPTELFEILRPVGYDLRPGDLGENVSTSGVDLESLPLGTILCLGDEAAVELTGLRTPCVLIDRYRGGLKRQMIATTPDLPKYRCGVMAVVCEGGAVMIGNPVRVRLPCKPWRTLPAL